MTTMTFPMSPLSPSATKVQIDEQEQEDVDEDTPLKSLKEIEEEREAEKKQQQRFDDIALVISMIFILIITCVIVVTKIYVFDPVPDPNITTFRPLDQQINSNIRYNGNGYLPCNGFVPCQPDQLSPRQLAERLEDAEPCHNYNNHGAGPLGCW